MRFRLSCATAALVRGRGRARARRPGAPGTRPEYERADIERGAQLYDEFCSTCHGSEGDGVGSVNLMSGQFRHASTDQNFRRILTNGIPAAGMPPGNYTDADMLALIAYVRNMRDYDGGVVTLGDAARGRAIFLGQGRLR